MSTLADVTDRLGARFTSVGGVRIPARFARPERTHHAVRSGVGVTVHPWGVIEVSGDDRRAFLGDTLTCRLPDREGPVAYGFLLDPDGRIEADLYVAETSGSLLCLTGPGTASSLAETLGSRTFIQDVSVTDRTDGHVVVGVHGPAVEPKLSSVVRRGEIPESRLAFTRATVRETDTTAVRLDAPAGEPGVAVLCRAAEAGPLFDALVNLGSPAVPFGYDTWLDLTLEAATPLLETELAGRQANVCGQIGDAVDLDKGCFVGQEAVARVANLAEPRERLVGLHVDGPPGADARVQADDDHIGQLTRAMDRPEGDGTIAFAVVAAEAIGSELSVRGSDGDSPATIASLPFVEGSARSGRIPRFST